MNELTESPGGSATDPNGHVVVDRGEKGTGDCSDEDARGDDMVMMAIDNSETYTTKQ